MIGGKTVLIGHGRAFDKALKTIRSSTTREHFMVCYKYISLYAKQYPEDAYACWYLFMQWRDHNKNPIRVKFDHNPKAIMEGLLGYNERTGL